MPEKTVDPGLLSTLVVDDSSVARAALCSILQSNDHVVIVGTASDGCEAVEFARLRHPRLILMDVQMPRMNGVAATEMLKRELPDTEIILVSTHDSPELRLLSEQSGARAFVAKQRLSKELALILAAIVDGPTADLK